MPTPKDSGFPIKRFPLPATCAYILMIVIINDLFTHLPMIHLYGSEVSPADIIVGMIYVVRDFAQREIQHWVLLAMCIGAAISYLFASKEVAIASLVAFIIGETIDWIIFTYTRKPLSERILWSSLISTPVDSFVFLYMLNQLNIVGMSLLSAGKIFGVFCLWAWWRRKNS